MDGNLMYEEPETPESETIVEPAPKKRGRKPLPRDADGNVIRAEKPARAQKADEGETIDVSAPAHKKRGRPAGGTKKSIDSAALAYQLVGIHQLIARLPGMEAFAIGDDEAKILAPAMADFSREYGVSVSPKAAATVQLMGALAMVYGPRVAATMENARARKKHARADSSAESVSASVATLRPDASQNG